MYQAGADVVTLGNHTFGKGQILRRLEEDPYLLRPANYTGRAPGRGYGVYDCGHIQIAVMSLIGRCGLDFNADNPFATAHRLLAGERPRFTLVDFHAEATSEKLAMAYYLDGRGLRSVGAPTPTCPPPTSRSCPGAPATRRTWG